MIVFETKELRVAYTEGNSAFLWITFTPNANPESNPEAAMAKQAAENGISLLGFIATKPNWYPEADMKKAVKALKPILAKHSEKVCSGASMGGFAALRYAKLLKSDVTIAFSPQYSMHAKDLPAKFQSALQQRLTALKTTPASLDKNMRIAAAAANGRAYVFYDSTIEIDAAHVKLIGEKSRFTGFAMPYASHNVQRMFVAAPAIARLLALCRTDDVSGLRLFVRERQKTFTPFRALNLGAQLSDRHKHWAMALYDRYAAVDKDTAHYALCANKIAQLALHNGYPEWAVKVGQEILARQENNTQALYLLVDAYTKHRDLGNEVPALKKLISLEPRNVPVRNKLLHALIRLPDIAAARLEVDAALRLFPEHPELLCRASEVAAKQENFEEALSCERKLITLAPTHNTPWRSLRMGRLSLKAGHFEEARTLFEQILQTESPQALNLHASALNSLVDVAFHQENLPEAVRLQRKVIELEPDQPFARNRLLLLLRNGELATAQAEAALALQLHPGHPALLNRAREIEQKLNPPVRNKDAATLG